MFEGRPTKEEIRHPVLVFTKNVFSHLAGQGLIVGPNQTGMQSIAEVVGYHKIGEPLTRELIVVRHGGTWDAELPSHLDDIKTEEAKARLRYYDSAQLAVPEDKRKPPATYEELADFAGRLGVRQFTEVSIRNILDPNQQLAEAFAHGLNEGRRPTVLSHGPKAAQELNAWGPYIKGLFLGHFTRQVQMKAAAKAIGKRPDMPSPFTITQKES